MHIPVLKKLISRNDLLIERVLPTEGQLQAEVGDEVEPFNKLGTCKVIYQVVDLGNKFKPSSKPIDKTTSYGNYSKGAFVGKYNRIKFLAPYNGSLIQTSQGNFLFKAEPKDYWLLPGVWGTIEDVSQERSVLIRTQAVDVHVPITTGVSTSGELVVFPNPSEVLAAQYFDNYIKSGFGKIVYVGHTVSKAIIMMAKAKGVAVVLGGSADKDVFEFAKDNKIGMGLFSGFGEINTPDFIYEFLEDVSNRYVFFYSDLKVLQVPIPAEKIKKGIVQDKKILRFVKKGLKVQVLTSLNFGSTGVVDSVSKNSIFVKLDGKDEVVEVMLPNILAIE